MHFRTVAIRRGCFLFVDWFVDSFAAAVLFSECIVGTKHFSLALHVRTFEFCANLLPRIFAIGFMG